VENCDGTNKSCPADAMSPDTDGDSTCDLIDNCNGLSNPSQADGDNDGLGDACDPCTNTGGSFAIRKRIVLQKILNPTGDDKLTMKGQVTIPTLPAINPAANGVRVLLENGVPAQMLDVTIPGGAYMNATKTGWRSSPTGTRFVYKKGAPTIADPIQGVTISTSPRTPGVYKFSIKGKNGAFPVTPGQVPLHGTFVIDSPTAETGQCAEVVFPASTSCKFNPPQSSVVCK
jgi:hypothetical protein